MSKHVERADTLIEKGQAVLRTHRPNTSNVIGFPTLDDEAFAAWRAQTLAFLTSVLGSGHVYATNFEEKVRRGFTSSTEAGIGILRAVREDLAAGDLTGPEPELAPAPLTILQQISERFHLVARQLRQRHEGRETLSVDDEYDVQDLLRSLLSLFFEDVREEEANPSYAGKNTRSDFLLKAEQIVIEVKKTRRGLGAKEVGRQLIEDIARYQTHPDCKALVCFVYDPEGLIANPRGLESDLTSDTPMPVRVYIRPR